MGTDNDLYITVPSFFRCPISLDVMKSPVSLCTGVTYDRASIQRWLDDGNNTCPATMQVLPSKDFVPNRTLHRLIQIWSDSLRLDRPESDSDSDSDNSTNSNKKDDAPPHKDHVADLIRRRSSSLDSLAKIERFAKESEENRKFLGGIDAFAPLLAEALGNAGDDIRVLELVVRIIQILIGDSAELPRLLLNKTSGNGNGNGEGRDCLASLLLVLQQGSGAESRIAVARVLELVAVSAESKLLIAERDGVLPELLKLTSLEKEPPSVIEAGLSCLIALSVPRRVKVKLVRLGAVKSMSKLLSDSKSTTATIEKVLKLLETVSSVKEGRAKICEAEECCCVSVIVGRLLKVSISATEHAVTILWSVCYLFKERSAQEAVTKANGLTKILLLMQSNCSPCVRQMSADLLKIFRVNSKSIISCYDTKTTHIMPF